MRRGDRGLWRQARFRLWPTDSEAGSLGRVQQLSAFHVLNPTLRPRLSAAEVLRCPVKQHMGMTPGPTTPPRYGFATDTWAVGIVAYELLTGLPPFAADCRVEVRGRAHRGGHGMEVWGPDIKPEMPWHALTAKRGSGPFGYGTESGQRCCQDPGSPNRRTSKRSCGPVWCNPNHQAKHLAAPYGAPQAEARICAAAPPLFPSGLSSLAKDFILRALSPHPIDRPTVRQMQQHPWITGFTGPVASPSPPAARATSSLHHHPYAHGMQHASVAAYPHQHPLSHVPSTGCGVSYNQHNHPISPYHHQHHAYSHGAAASPTVSYHQNQAAAMHSTAAAAAAAGAFGSVATGGTTDPWVVPPPASTAASGGASTANSGPAHCTTFQVACAKTDTSATDHQHHQSAAAARAAAALVSEAGAVATVVLVPKGNPARDERQGHDHHDSYMHSSVHDANAASCISPVAPRGADQQRQAPGAQMMTPGGSMGAAGSDLEGQQQLCEQLRALQQQQLHDLSRLPVSQLQAVIMQLQQAVALQQQQLRQLHSGGSGGPNAIGMGGSNGGSANTDAAGGSVRRGQERRQEHDQLEAMSAVVMADVVMAEAGGAASSLQALPAQHHYHQHQHACDSTLGRIGAVAFRPSTTHTNTSISWPGSAPHHHHHAAAAPQSPLAVASPPHRAPASQPHHPCHAAHGHGDSSTSQVSATAYVTTSAPTAAAAAVATASSYPCASRHAALEHRAAGASCLHHHTTPCTPITQRPRQSYTAQQHLPLHLTTHHLTHADHQLNQQAPVLVVPTPSSPLVPHHHHHQQQQQHVTCTGSPAAGPRPEVTGPATSPLMVVPGPAPAQPSGGANVHVHHGGAHGQGPGAGGGAGLHEGDGLVYVSIGSSRKLPSPGRGGEDDGHVAVGQDAAAWVVTHMTSM